MDSFRSLFGIPTTASTGRAPSAMRTRAEAQQKGVSVQDQLQQQVNASEVKLKVNAARVQRAENDKNNAISVRNKSMFDMASRELEEAHTETKTINALLINQRAQLRKHQEAQSNIDMAITMRAGAEELSAANAAMEELDVEDTMETLRDAASTVNQHSRILAEPIVSSTRSPHQLDVDQEWQALIAQQQQQAAAAPVTAAAATTTTTTTTVNTTANTAPARVAVKGEK